MRDDICTIPISEVFEPKDGCPICRMRNTIESRMVEYILGAAMMEPDVRIKTNELGFCKDHLEMMMKGKNRLSLALILETHLDSVKNELFKKSFIKPSAKKTAYKAARIEETCFVCDRIQWGMERLIATTLRMYANESDFRRLFKDQECLCLPHYRLLMEEASNSMDKKRLSDFSADCNNLAEKYLSELTVDVNKFTKMFDYRNAGGETDEFDRAKDSIERAFAFLTSRGEM
ncbi:MAG: hypothetical protein IJF54_06765 [Clostridia bacterium]|nr:hypothetical protein [Clostridia bacterium]